MITTEKAWKLLNEMGIYTEKQLIKYSKENPLNVGMFTMPPKEKEDKQCKN